MVDLAASYSIAARPAAGSPLYLQMETVDVQVVSTWRAVLVAFGSPQIPKRNWRI